MSGRAVNGMVEMINGLENRQGVMEKEDGGLDEIW
jgi:hypothetical protein